MFLKKSININNLILKPTTNLFKLNNNSNLSIRSYTKNNNNNNKKNIEFVKTTIGYLQSLDIVEFHKGNSKKELDEVNKIFEDYGNSSNNLKKYFSENLDPILNLNLESNNLEFALKLFDSFKKNENEGGTGGDGGQKLNCFKETFHSILLKHIESNQHSKSVEILLNNLNILNEYIESNYFLEYLQLIYDNNKSNVKKIIDQLQLVEKLYKPRITLPIFIHFYLKNGHLRFAEEYYKNYKQLKFQPHEKSISIYYAFMQFYYKNNYSRNALALFNSVILELEKEESVLMGSESELEGLTVSNSDSNLNSTSISSSTESDLSKNKNRILKEEFLKKKKAYHRFTVYQVLFELVLRNYGPNKDNNSELNKLVKELIKSNCFDLPYLIFYNQLEYCRKGNPISIFNLEEVNQSKDKYSVIFYHLLNSLYNLKDFQKILIVDTLINLFIHFSSYDRALFWYGFLLNKLNILPNTSITKNFTFYRINQIISNKQDIDEFWNHRYRDLIHQIPESHSFINPHDPEKIFYLFKQFLYDDASDGKNNNSNISENNFVKPYYSALNSLNTQITKSTSPILFSKNYLFLNRDDEALIILITNKISEENQQKLLDHLVENYFKIGKIPPNEKLILALARLTNNSKIYEQFLMAAPEFIKVLTFNGDYYNRYKTMLDINEFIRLVSLENQTSVINSTVLLNSMVIQLIRNENYQECFELLNVLISKRFKILESSQICHKIFNKMKSQSIEYPKEIFDNYFLVKFSPSDENATLIYNCYLLHLIRSEEYQKALKVFDSVKSKNQATFDLGCQIYYHCYSNIEKDSFVHSLEKWDRLLDIKNKYGFYSITYYEYFIKALFNSEHKQFITKLYKNNPDILQNITMDTFQLIAETIPEKKHHIFVDFFFKSNSFKFYPQPIIDRLTRALKNLDSSFNYYDKLVEFLNNYKPVLPKIKQIRNTIKITESNLNYFNSLINKLKSD